MTIIDYKKMTGEIREIIAIRETGFMVDESLYEEGKEAYINLHHSTKTKEVEDKLLVDLKVSFACKNEKDYMPFMESTTSTIFLIPGLADFITPEKKILLGPATMLQMVMHEISHARAIICRSAAGTSFQQIVLPLFNIAEVTKSFFPYAAKEIDDYIKEGGNIILF